MNYLKVEYITMSLPIMFPGDDPIPCCPSKPSPPIGNFWPAAPKDICIMNQILYNSGDNANRVVLKAKPIHTSVWTEWAVLRSLKASVMWHIVITIKQIFKFWKREKRHLPPKPMAPPEFILISLSLCNKRHNQKIFMSLYMQSMAYSIKFNSHP